MFGLTVIAEHERLIEAGWKFAESGAMAGHLNFRMGEPGRVLLAAVEEAGIPALVASLAGEPVFLAQGVGNLNLPGSHAQDYHMDGNFQRRLFIANVCLVPTDIANGATALVPGSNHAAMSYWRFSRGGWPARAVRPALKPGDVLIRPSNLWHRGTPNRTARPRPMGAFSWLPQSLGGAPGEIADLDGPLTIFGNEYYGRWRRMKEFTAVRLPWMDEGLRLGKSFYQDWRAAS